MQQHPRYRAIRVGLGIAALLFAAALAWRSYWPAAGATATLALAFLTSGWVALAAPLVFYGHILLHWWPGTLAGLWLVTGSAWYGSLLARSRDPDSRIQPNGWDWLEFCWGRIFLFGLLALRAVASAVLGRQPVAGTVHTALHPHIRRYHTTLVRRAEKRHRKSARRRGLQALLQAMEAQNATFVIEQVQIKDRDGVVRTDHRRIPLFDIECQVLADTPDRFVVQYLPRYLRRDPAVIKAWKAVLEVAPDLLHTAPGTVRIEPLSGTITWTAVDHSSPPPAEQARPASPWEPLTRTWALSGGDDQSPVVPGAPPLHQLTAQGRQPGRPTDGTVVASRVLSALQKAGVLGAEVREIQVGPTVISITLSPPATSRVSLMTRAGDDLATDLGVEGVICQPVTDGTPGLVVQVPREHPEIVHLRPLAATDEFRTMAATEGTLAAAVGVTAAGAPLLLDVSTAPHILTAGTTGSGKSVTLNAILTSLLLAHSPDSLRLILCDPKRVDFLPYRLLPHLLCPVLSETTHMQKAVAWVVREMNDRYSLLAEAGVDSVAEYNAKAPRALPRIVLGCDELADLLLSGSRSDRDTAETGLIRLAQKARACGIHLLLGTQKPIVDVVPTLLKGNVPTRIACRTPTQAESQVILDCSGAEKLRRRGDMLVLTADGMLTRAQGTLVERAEVERIVGFWASNRPQEFNTVLMIDLDRQGK